jgi:hypothetical protein
VLAASDGTRGTIMAVRLRTGGVLSMAIHRSDIIADGADDGAAVAADVNAPMSSKVLCGGKADGGKER